ncbi:hypothetical protein [Streptomyces sp. GS7]|uniref:hypothetical protein n=1 Tax=Streptomyces sp. GS7 TaxID=2692234 RepID=UPI002E2CE1EE|nr:hypothetical protein [Streptomyces sp. GS7]
MAADVAHVALGVAHAASAMAFAVPLALVLILWRRAEGTLQPVGDAGARPAGRSAQVPFLIRGRELCRCRPHLHTCSPTIRPSSSPRPLRQLRIRERPDTASALCGRRQGREAVGPRPTASASRSRRRRATRPSRGCAPGG